VLESTHSLTGKERERDFHSNKNKTPNTVKSGRGIKK
jgi:hypothetical protein